MVPSTPGSSRSQPAPRCHRPLPAARTRHGRRRSPAHPARTGRPAGARRSSACRSGSRLPGYFAAIAAAICGSGSGQEAGCTHMTYPILRPGRREATKEPKNNGRRPDHGPRANPNQASSSARHDRASTLAGVGGARTRIWSVRRDSRATIWATRAGWRGAVRLGAGRFGLRRPSSVRLASLAQRSRGATTSGRMAARSTAFGPCRQRERISRSGCIRRPMGHPPGPTTPYAARRRFARRLSVPSGRQRQRDLTPCHF